MSKGKFNFNYDIKINEDDRPFIHLDEDFENQPEHTFMIFEMSRYLLYDLLEKNKKHHTMEEETEFKIGEMSHFMTQISDELAVIVKGGMTAMDDINGLINGETPDNE